MKLNPWVGVSLIAIGVVAAIAFQRTNVPELGLCCAIVSVGVAVIHGYVLGAQQRELRTLRASVRPPPIDLAADPDATKPPPSSKVQ